MTPPTAEGGFAKRGRSFRYYISNLNLSSKMGEKTQKMGDIHLWMAPNCTFEDIGRINRRLVYKST